MGGEEGERRNEGGGPDGGCELDLVSRFGIWEMRGGQQTIQIPAWAIIAVPGAVDVSMCCMAWVRGNSRCTEDEVKLYALSILL